MKEFKTTEELIKENNKFINSIPNYLGINLVSVLGIQYEKQDNGDLLSLKIVFKKQNQEQKTKGCGDFRCSHYNELSYAIRKILWK